MSVARRKGAVKSLVLSHGGIRSLGVISGVGPVKLASNGRAIVTVHLVIDAGDIERELSRKENDSEWCAPCPPKRNGARCFASGAARNRGK